MGKVCFLCKSSEDNELLFGKFYSKWKLTVHYYCLLLSSNLVQGGNNDTVGIFGFLESDIRKENERTKKCRCYICKSMHANVSCCSKKCLRTFHTVCGIMNGCLSHYTDTYQSWCSAHLPLESDSSPHTREEVCSICYDEMGQYDVITSIKAPCCLNGWFHQRCLAQYAQSAGYFFKCPLCKNEDKFLSEIPLRGVFVPERDAAWELEPNAFQEQLLRPTACDADDCKCLEGRNVDNRQWRLKACGSCGSTCRHLQCMEQTSADSRVYVCQLCRPILGENVPLPENANDSGDSSDDDTASTSSSTSFGRTLRDRAGKNLSRAGSGESGVHCSSSDETLGTIRRLVIARKNLSDGSDSERSDASSIQIRRCIRQNTGKRVRRLLSDGSENEKSNQTSDTPISSCTDGQSETNVGNRLEDNSDTTGTLAMGTDQSSQETESDEKSCPSDRSRAVVSSTKQLSRRLSSLSDSSKRSTSESNFEDRRPTTSISRRPRIVSSSSSSSFDEMENYPSEIGETKSQMRSSPRQRDSKPSSSILARRSRLASSSEESEKQLEGEKGTPPVLNIPLVQSTQCPTTSQRNSRVILRAKKSKNPSTTCGRATEATSQEEKRSGKQRKSPIPSNSNDVSNPITSKRWDENSNMTGTVLLGGGRSPLGSEKDENAISSDTSLEKSVATRRTRQLARRQPPLHDASKRSTSESSMETVRPKRTRAARSSTLFDEAEKRTENGENKITDRHATAQLNKRPRPTRERCNKTNQIPAAKRPKPSSISPPSTPPSLASESSQPSVASNSNTCKTGVKHTGGNGTPNRQQQSMLQFITFSTSKSAATSDSSDLSTEETVSPSWWARFGSSNKINRKSSPIRSKRETTTTTTTKRSRTHSPKKSNIRSANEQEAEMVATSSKAPAPQRTQKAIVHKDKGQKNILNYFNRY